MRPNSVTKISVIWPVISPMMPSRSRLDVSTSSRCAAEVFIPLVHAGKFVDGAEVRRAEAGDLPCGAPRRASFRQPCSPAPPQRRARWSASAHRYPTAGREFAFPPARQHFCATPDGRSRAPCSGYRGFSPVLPFPWPSLRASTFARSASAACSSSLPGLRRGVLPGQLVLLGLQRLFQLSGLLRIAVDELQLLLAVAAHGMLQPAQLLGGALRRGTLGLQSGAPPCAAPSGAPIRRLLCSEATLWPSETTAKLLLSLLQCRSAGRQRPSAAPRGGRCRRRSAFRAGSCSRCEPVIASVRACTRTWCCFSSPCRRRAASSAVRRSRLRVRQVIIRLLQQTLRLLLLSAELVQRGGGLLLLAPADARSRWRATGCPHCGRRSRPS